jgi:hypothetical protein
MVAALVPAVPGADAIERRREKSFIIRDFFILETLRPGESLTNKVDIRQYFDVPSEALCSSGILFFWSYQLEPSGAPAWPRVGGWLVLKVENKDRR